MACCVYGNCMKQDTEYCGAKHCPQADPHPSQNYDAIGKRLREILRQREERFKEPPSLEGQSHPTNNPPANAIEAARDPFSEPAILNDLWDSAYEDTE